MKKKKFLNIILVLLIILFLSACTNSNTINNDIKNSGWIRGKVLLDNDYMLVSGLIIENEDGKRWHTTTDILGAYDIELNEGKYTITYTRGSEYSKVSKEVIIESYQTQFLEDIKLTKLNDLYSKGWISGDLHMHSFYSDGGNSPSEQLLSNISQGLYFGFLTDHNTNNGIQEWLGGNSYVCDKDINGKNINYKAFSGYEITTSFGHFQSLGTNVNYDKSLYELGDEEENDDLVIKNKIINIANEIKENGGVSQINHPYSTRNMGFQYWDLVDYFDTIEIWNGIFVPGDGRYENKTLEQNYQSKLKWYELLNNIKNGGKFLAATCGTDNHDVTSSYTPYSNIDEIKNMSDYNEVYYSNGRYSGVPSIYVYCPKEKNSNNILNAIVNGHSFLSNGITVLANVNGASYGDTAKISKTTTLDLSVYSRDGLDKIQVIKNGEVMKEILLNDTIQSYDSSIILENIKEGDWITLEVFGPNALYAITNPIFFSNK